eukprot:jgi/Picsp_1/6657/NSC_04000-R1_---NA---
MTWRGLTFPDGRVCAYTEAQDAPCQSNGDCPDSKPICLFAGSEPSRDGFCGACAHSLDCRDDLLCSATTFTCEPGPKIVKPRCGPQDDNIRSYEVDVPLYTGRSKDGYISFEISKWPMYVSSIRFDTSSKSNQRMDLGQIPAYLSPLSWIPVPDLNFSSDISLEDQNLNFTNGYYSFVDGLIDDVKDLAEQAGVDVGSYVVDGTSTVNPAIGKYIIIGRSSARLLILENIKRVRACVRRVDYDWQGNPLNPISGRIEYEKQFAARSRSSSSRSSQDERYCDGYAKEGDPACPVGSKCVGKYMGATAGATPRSTEDDPLHLVACGTVVFEDGKCQVGDIRLDDRGFKCPSAFGNPWSPVLPLCGTCQPSASACNEVQSAEIVSMNYPSAAKSVVPSGAQVSSETTVSNAGDIEQSTSVTLQFSSTQTNTVTVTKALANNIQASLKMSIPIPVLKPDGTITAGQTQTFTNAEAQTSTSTVQVTNTQNIKIPPKTKQTVIGKINTQNVRIEVPITVKVKYTCGKEEDMSTTAEMMSDGTLLQGTTSFDISYGFPESLA